MTGPPAATATTTRVATANVLRTLPRSAAREALDLVLARDPDLVALQEWGPRRRSLLPRGAWVWVGPGYGGVTLGARRDRYTLLRRRRHLLAGAGRVDRRVRPVPWLPPRVATAATYADRLTGRTVTLVGYHLVPGTQSRGAYRADRPRLVGRHRAEVAALGAVVTAYLGRGHRVVALGDSNFDGLVLPGLTSAWDGRRDDPRGTLGSSRKIDDVLGLGPALAVDLVATPSDHRAVVVLRRD